MKTTPILALTLAVGLGGAAQAASVSVSTNMSGAADTSALAGFATTGADMDGMRVTARFSTGATQTATWAGTGGTAGSAIGTSWLVSLAGDSFTTPFFVSHTLVGALLTGLLFQGAPGDTVFDIVASPSLSPGSASGRAYTDQSSPTGTINVVYSRPLSVGGTFFGDLFLNMDVDYSGLTGGGLAANTSLSFISDTDNVRIPGDITPGVIPVPAAGWLLLSALAGLGAMARRRRAA